MSARVLVVDDLAPNRNLLEVKLSAEYYDVVTAADGLTALDIARAQPIDLILMDAIMPGLNGFETCQRLKADPDTWHIPVVMVTALEEIKDRIRGLEAGADDFITKPIDDFNLMARVRSLLRLKMVTDQLLTHTGQTLAESRPLMKAIDNRPGRVLIVEDHPGRARKFADPLRDLHTVEIEPDPKRAMERAKAGIDVVIVSLLSEAFDGLRLCASLRFDVASRDLPIVVVGDAEDELRLVRAYDLGINDTLMRPIDRQEMVARVGTQLRRKLYADSLRENFNESLEMVVSDPLTGLGNRRYFERSVEPMIAEVADGKALSIAVCDIDHFKRVNDILGHDTGDSILKDLAARLASNVRAVDVVSRYGGEEFMIAMPGTDIRKAMAATERVRRFIGDTPFYLDGQALSVTVSAGVAQVRPGERLRDVFKRADSALYAAKHAGRNRVKMDGVEARGEDRSAA